MSFCTAQLSPAQSFWRTKPNSNKASAQVNSISTAACRCHRRHLPPRVIAPLRFCRPRLGDSLNPDGVASSRGDRGASQRLRVRHADGGGGGACPPGPRPALLLPRAPPRPPQVQPQGSRLPGHPPRPRPRGERKGPRPPLALFMPAVTRRGERRRDSAPV